DVHPPDRDGRHGGPDRAAHQPHRSRRSGRRCARHAVPGVLKEGRRLTCPIAVSISSDVACAGRTALLFLQHVVLPRCTPTFEPMSKGEQMQRRDLNAPDAPAPVAAYTQAIEVSGATRTLYISGQVGLRTDGTIPDDIVEQSRLTWQNLEAQLRAA